MSLNQDNLIETMRKIFVTIELFEAKFAPVQAIAFGAIALIAMTVGGFVLKLILQP